MTAVASDVLQGIAVHFDSQFPIDPRMFLSVGNVGATLLRWGSTLDMLGYYLPLLPAAVLLHAWLKPNNPVWVSFITTCGLGYIFIGAVGAVTMAVIQPPLIQAYAQAASNQRLMLETIFGTIWNIVYAGMWNILGVLLAGIWFLGIGLLLRSERQGIAILGMLTGLAALSDSIGNMLGIEGLAMFALLLFLLLLPVWLLWFGIDLLRKPVEIDRTAAVSTASAGQ